ncbi:hypothetical protein MRY87_00855 [bacterium]|nr:hypothetical protein [bacterium]
MRSRALTPGLIATAHARISRTRELPVPGEILVEIGEQVRADQVVARAELAGELYILRLPERMGLEVSEVLEGLQVKEGDAVEPGDLLCSKSGLFGLLSTEAKAPEQGVVEFIARGTGHLGLRLPPNQITVDAYISGSVAEVDPEKSVTIESDLAFVQGIFGVGGERKGRVTFLPIEPDEEIGEELFSDQHRGAICIGGSRPTFSALRRAEEVGIAGLICGSLDDEVLATFLGYELGIALTGDEDIPFSIMITEGFGVLPLSERVYRALEGREGVSASMNGKTQVRAGAVRPELLVEEKERREHSPRVEPLQLEVGARIRLLRVPYFGKFAEITALPIAEEYIPTGAKTRVLRARLEDGQEVTVPRANVELVENARS